MSPDVVAFHSIVQIWPYGSDSPDFGLKIRLLTILAGSPGRADVEGAGCEEPLDDTGEDLVDDESEAAILDIMLV